MVKKIKDWSGTPICLDSEGAQLRNQQMASDQTNFIKGEKVIIHSNEIIGDKNNISFSPHGIVQQFSEGDRIKIDFNGTILKVVEVAKDNCLAVVVGSGLVGSNKAADVDRKLEFDPLTK